MSKKNWNSPAGNNISQKISEDVISKKLKAEDSSWGMTSIWEFPLHETYLNELEERMYGKNDRNIWIFVEFLTGRGNAIQSTGPCYKCIPFPRYNDSLFTPRPLQPVFREARPFSYNMLSTNLSKLQPARQHRRIYVYRDKLQIISLKGQWNRFQREQVRRTCFVLDSWRIVIKRTLSALDLWNCPTWYDNWIFFFFVTFVANLMLIRVIIKL